MASIEGLKNIGKRVALPGLAITLAFVATECRPASYWPSTTPIQVDIGDSLTQQAGEHEKVLYPNEYWNGLPGRTVPQGLAILRRLHREKKDAKRVLFKLGTNRGINLNQIKGVLDNTAPNARVVIPTIHRGDDPQLTTSSNAAIIFAAHLNPRLRTTDWYVKAVEPGNLTPEGTHLTGQGVLAWDTLNNNALNGK